MPRGLCLAFVLALAFTLVVSAPALAQEEPLPGQAPGLEEPPPSPAPPPPGTVAPPPAQPAPTPAHPTAPAARPSIELPPSLAWFPVESGRLDRHLDLQFFWSHISYSANILGSSFSISAEAIMLGIEGQYAFADVFEVGLTIPFLVQSMASAVGGSSSSSSNFGNLVVDLKAKVAGRSNGPYAVSLFTNWMLPTMSGLSEKASRDFAILHGGVAASGALGLLTLGGALGTIWAIQGSGKDLVFTFIDLHAAARFHRVIAGYLMTQIAIPVYPEMDDRTPAVAISPGVQIYPLPAPIDGFHLDLGVRIATNDQAKALYSVMSRAQLTFAMGYAF